ncbi:MAG: ATP-binding protein [Roseburia sp.]
MKKLMRVKLINWHRFTNTMIEFEKSTLISGENGAGKSTLLDAIQFVVICSTNYFNKAAHENGKRKLTGYIRCKTGRENRPYERTGEISAHIALEFYEEKRDKYFVVGAVVDSASEGQEKTARYLMDGIRLEDSLFFQGKTPKSINQFRTTNAKKIKQWCTTDKEARSMIKNRFGRIEDKFFRLIPKALAFRPIDDIKDFVYSYVLDEKEVNIDVLRENVRTYQDLQRTLENVKIRIGRLEKIGTMHDQAVDGLQKDRQYEYYLARAEADLVSSEKQELDRRIEQLMKKKLSYAEDVERVRTAIKEEFQRIGRTPEPRILCEMLEITDDSWRNAVEGYLNTQRFYILVEPENFDIALGIYDRLRKEKKAYAESGSV